MTTHVHFYARCRQCYEYREHLVEASCEASYVKNFLNIDNIENTQEFVDELCKEMIEDMVLELNKEDEDIVFFEKTCGRCGSSG